MTGVVYSWAFWKFVFDFWIKILKAFMKIYLEAFSKNDWSKYFWTFFLRKLFEFYMKAFYHFLNLQLLKNLAREAFLNWGFRVDTTFSPPSHTQTTQTSKFHWHWKVCFRSNCVQTLLKCVLLWISSDNVPIRDSPAVANYHRDVQH